MPGGWLVLPSQDLDLEPQTFPLQRKSDWRTMHFSQRSSECDLEILAGYLRHSTHNPISVQKFRTRVTACRETGSRKADVIST